MYSGSVKNLIIDSLEGNLYWSTSRTVEVVHLNGEDKRQYRSQDNFNAHHVVAMTLDFENRFVYWIVGDYAGDYKLYQALTVDMLPSDKAIASELVSYITLNYTIIFT